MEQAGGIQQAWFRTKFISAHSQEVESSKKYRDDSQRVRYEEMNLNEKNVRRLTKSINKQKAR